MDDRFASKVGGWGILRNGGLIPLYGLCFSEKTAIIDVAIINRNMYFFYQVTKVILEETYGTGSRKIKEPVFEDILMIFSKMFNYSSFDI